MCRVMIYECCAPSGPPIASLLSGESFELFTVTSRSALMEEILQRRPDVLIYGLGQSCEQDLGMARLVRSAAPEVPLILVASDDSLLTQKLAQDLGPIYYAVRPVDDADLAEAVRAAAASRRPRTSIGGA